MEKYLEKIFANVGAVYCAMEGAPNFSGLVSKEGEILPVKSVTWKNEDVEKWINNMIDKMQLAMKTQIYGAF